MLSDDILEGCFNVYPKDDCYTSEKLRVYSIHNEPAKQFNYTQSGFAVVKAPIKLMNILRTFYDNNQDEMTLEHWDNPFTITNHWMSPSYAIHVDNRPIVNMTHDTKAFIYEQAQMVLEDWVKQVKLTPVSMYGIAIYKEDAIIAPHLDSSPLIISAMINVYEDLRVPWKIELRDHFGKFHEITLGVGEMLLYEVFNDIFLLIIELIIINFVCDCVIV
jgi:hypothetical protein